MKEKIEKKIKILNEGYDYYLMKLDDVGETDYLNNRLLEIRAKIRILEELLGEIEPIEIGGLHRGLFIPEIYIENIKLHDEVNGARKQRRKVREKIKKLQQENQQLKKQKDDVVEYIKKHFQDDEGIICKYVGDNACEINENFIDDLLRMLGETDETDNLQ